MSNNQELNNFIASLSQGRFTTDQLTAEQQEQVMHVSLRVARRVIEYNTCENGIASMQSNAMSLVADLSIHGQQLVAQAPNSEATARLEARLSLLQDQYAYRANKRLEKLGGQ